MLYYIAKYQCFVNINGNHLCVNITLWLIVFQDEEGCPFFLVAAHISAAEMTLVLTNLCVNTLSRSLKSRYKPSYHKPVNFTPAGKACSQQKPSKHCSSSSSEREAHRAEVQMMFLCTCAAHVTRCYFWPFTPGRFYSCQYLLQLKITGANICVPNIICEIASQFYVLLSVTHLANSDVTARLLESENDLKHVRKHQHDQTED